MSPDQEMITRKEALKQIKLATRRTALLYHHFAQTLIEELGRPKAVEVITKAIKAYGDHIGRAAQEKALAKGHSLTPENFESDLPDLAWEGEAVTVEGEKRHRVHHCPLAAEWLNLGQAEVARLYCWVDQAKMEAFNPEYTYVHLKNLLDGDECCELAVRKKERI